MNEDTKLLNSSSELSSYLIIDSKWVLYLKASFEFF